jgi:hypothetical protein
MNHFPFDHMDLKKNHGAKVLRIIGMVFVGVIFAVFFALVFGLLVMVLWNWLMPAIFGLGKIGFWQAFGIVLLSKLLFGGSGHHPRDHHRSIEKKMQQKFHPKFGPCPDDFQHKPGNGDKWKNFRHFWEDEGRAAFDEYVRRSEGEPVGDKEEKT